MGRGWAGVPVQSAMEAIRIEPRLDAWLSQLNDCGGTDMLLTADSPPLMRVDLRLVRLEGWSH